MVWVVEMELSTVSGVEILLLLVSLVLVRESKVVMTLQMLSRMVLARSQRWVLTMFLSASLSGFGKWLVLEGSVWSGVQGDIVILRLLLAGSSSRSIANVQPLY